jgi:hypothetical protein
MNAIKVIHENYVSKEAQSILREAEKDDRGAVLISKDFQGLTVQAGSTVMNKEGVRREEVRMETALKELVDKGYLSQTGTNLYQITDRGYKFLDENVEK